MWKTEKTIPKSKLNFNQKQYSSLYIILQSNPTLLPSSEVTCERELDNTFLVFRHSFIATLLKLSLTSSSWPKCWLNRLACRGISHTLDILWNIYTLYVELIRQIWWDNAGFYCHLIIYLKFVLTSCVSMQIFNTKTKTLSISVSIPLYPHIEVLPVFKGKDILWEGESMMRMSELAWSYAL